VQWKHLFLQRHQSKVVVCKNTLDTRPRTLEHMMPLMLLQFTVFTYNIIIIIIIVIIIIIIIIIIFDRCANQLMNRIQ